MDEEKKNIIQLMLGFVRRANGDHVSAYAAQAAYFLIMSFIPFILFLTTLIRYTPLSYNVVRDAIIGFVPGNLQTFVLSIVVEVYKRSTAIVPLSALMALWASGKGMQAITNRRRLDGRVGFSISAKRASFGSTSPSRLKNRSEREWSSAKTSQRSESTWQAL